MKLWLLRHGQAEPRAATDPERRLTDRGRQEAERAGLALQGASVDLLLHTSYRRAVQTAERVQAVAGLNCPVQTADWAIPEADVSAAIAHLDALSAQYSQILLVAHQPFLGALASLLVEGAVAGWPLHTGQLIELSGEYPLAGLMHLQSAGAAGGR